MKASRTVAFLNQDSTNFILAAVLAVTEHYRLLLYVSYRHSSRQFICLPSVYPSHHLIDFRNLRVSSLPRQFHCLIFSEFRV